MGRYRAGARRGVGGRPRGEPTKVVRVPVRVAEFARLLARGEVRAGDVQVFLDVEAESVAAVPFYDATAECGFPSPADDYLDRPLDFNELLVTNPAATFAVRMAGESMTGAGIFPGDIAVIDRSRTPTPGCIVLALVDGGFTVKRYRRHGDQVLLQAENPAFADTLLSAEQSFEVWGVVTHSIRML